MKSWVIAVLAIATSWNAVALGASSWTEPSALNKLEGIFWSWRCIPSESHGIFQARVHNRRSEALSQYFFALALDGASSPASDSWTQVSIQPYEWAYVGAIRISSCSESAFIWYAPAQ
ncbi:MAG: hypothetical protein A2X94_16465 [Bdellovibrionales bacterium GWB1_55_8]|nr:MAG: hypothetical protein A2X94_16465 [Bdellovibrionales bacterium GWB1_55_8]